MTRGVLVIRGAAKVLYVPVFDEDKDRAYTVLMEAMKRWESPGRKDPFYDRLDFYELADRMGKEQSGSHRFLGPEFVPFVPDEVFCDAAYVFTVDFDGRRIIVVK